MSSRKFHPRGFLLCFFFLQQSTVHAKPKGGLHLTNSSHDCLSGDVVRSEVKSYLGIDPFERGDTFAEGHYEWSSSRVHADYTLNIKNHISHHTLSAPTCKEVSNALILSLSIALEENPSLQKTISSTEVAAYVPYRWAIHGGYEMLPGLLPKTAPSLSGGGNLHVGPLDLLLDLSWTAPQNLGLDGTSRGFLSISPGIYIPLYRSKIISVGPFSTFRAGYMYEETKQTFNQEFWMAFQAGALTQIHLMGSWYLRTECSLLYTPTPYPLHHLGSYDTSFTLFEPQTVLFQAGAKLEFQFPLL